MCFYSTFFLSPFFHGFAVVRRRASSSSSADEPLRGALNPSNHKSNTFLVTSYPLTWAWKTMRKTTGYRKTMWKTLSPPRSVTCTLSDEFTTTFTIPLAVSHKVYHTTAFDYFGYFLKKRKNKRTKRRGDCPRCHPKAYGSNSRDSSCSAPLYATQLIT